MEYTVKVLAELAGVSARTLRYYDEIGLLNPGRTTPAGYRLYGPVQVERLQQILLYREMGVALEDIAQILDAPGFDRRQALLEHREKLLQKRQQMDMLIANVEKSLEAVEKRGAAMSDKERFNGFTQHLVKENEVRYGKEVREKYGDTVVEASNRKLQNMTREQYEEAGRLEIEIHGLLEEAWREGNPAGEKGQALAALHKRWLCRYWAEYTPEAHAGLAEMYVADSRFTAYYDPKGEGKASFLRDAIQHYAGIKEAPAQEQ